MPIKSIEISNFKRFKNQKLNLEKTVTVILGENSSGKSSILKALLGLKQTASPSNEHESWAAHGDYVDLGTYQDFVNKRDIRKKFGFSVTLDSDSAYRSLAPYRIRTTVSELTIDVEYDYDPVSSQARLLGIGAKFASPAIRCHWKLTRQKTRKNYNIRISENLVKAFDAAYGFDKGESLGYKPEFSVENTEKLTFRAASITNISQSLFIRSVNETISTLVNHLEKNVFYLAPLRSSPSRSYIRSSHNLAVGVRGEHTPSVLANLERRSQKATTGRSDLRDSYELFTNGLSRVFPGHRAKTTIISELVKLKIQSRETDSYSGTDKADTITDVGFGFSQVFPIIVQAAVMPKNATLVVEQPELHLHPMAQTRFAQFIAEAALLGKRFIIETHSEHLVRGLQLAISEGRAKKKGNKFTKDSVSFNYIRKASENDPPLEVNEFGEFTQEWPTGFFDESYKTTRQLLRNKLRSAG
ncbi:DUF3696 domain-containing protein [Stenotrophomonas maltophilia]|uniref:DUF3696 domain-containing protein n=1 Tax=Stenotrophomonas sp. TD3 TaxID=1641707 RepID=UPI000951479E|nr:DUF3696 domain-containing protein [Stenotrophomonas sp. TD3]MCU1181307.1 DUF3696 domain-containing protein [Stenotrophomonas maltophilia]